MTIIICTTGRDISKMMGLYNNIGEDKEEKVIVLNVIINNLLQVKEMLMRYKGIQVVEKRDPIHEISVVRKVILLLVVELELTVRDGLKITRSQPLGTRGWPKEEQSQETGTDR